MDQPLSQTPTLSREEQAKKQAEALRQANYGDYSYEHQVETNTASSDSSLLNSTDTKADADTAVNDAWNNLFMQAPAQIEYTPQVNPEEVSELRKIVAVEQKELNHDAASVLENMENRAEFSSGSLDFNNSNELNTPIPSLESSFGTEPALPVEHQQSVDLNLQTETVYHNDVDFKFFFQTTGGWAGEGINEASKFVLKHTFNTKSWGEAKTAIWDGLILKDIFGLGQKKKPETSEEIAAEQKKQKLAISARIFYDSLRNGLRSLVGADQRRALKSRIESINKSLKRGNLSYEGSLDQSGQVREDLTAEAEKANTQKSEEQIRAEKRQRLIMAGRGKAKAGPGITTSMDKSHNFNNAAKLAG